MILQSKAGFRTIEAIVTPISHWPRGILGWKTPAEAFEDQLRLVQQSTVAMTGEYGQFRSDAYVAELGADQLYGSMRRVGSSAGNAAMESFFALLQKTFLGRHA